jgi:diadenosine tetraphosphate (Ap4A) HIT family hydrolase
VPASVPEPCIACSIARGDVVPPGGVLLREGGLIVHGVAMATPLAGWLVVGSERHARGFYDLDDGELRELGPLAARVARAQIAALGAEHVYALAIGDVVRHFHLHLVPRYATTPERLRGRGAFDARPEDACPREQVEAAAEKVRRALGG